jgi:hypothetical protein
MAFLERYLTRNAKPTAEAGAHKARPYVGGARVDEHSGKGGHAGVGARLVRARDHLRLTVMLLGVLAVFAAEVRAQPEPKPPVTFRTLALGAPVAGVFYELEGKPVAVGAGSSGFSSSYVAPAAGRVGFYRLVPAERPEEKPRRVPVAEVQVGKGGPYLVLMIVDPETAAISTMLVEDSWETHPVKTARVFNFSRRRAMVKLAEEIVELPTTESHIFPYPDGNQVWLQAATKENETWVLRVGGPQVTLPKARSTVVLIDQPPSIERRNPYAVLVRNFIEFEPAPPAP